MKIIKGILETGKNDTRKVGKERKQFQMKLDTTIRDLQISRQEDNKVCVKEPRYSEGNGKIAILNNLGKTQKENISDRKEMKTGNETSGKDSRYNSRGNERESINTIRTC